MLVDEESDGLMLSLGHSVAVCVILICLLKFFDMFMFVMLLVVCYKLYHHFNRSSTSFVEDTESMRWFQHACVMDQIEEQQVQMHLQIKSLADRIVLFGKIRRTNFSAQNPKLLVRFMFWNEFDNYFQMLWWYRVYLEFRPAMVGYQRVMGARSLLLGNQ